MKKKLLVLAAVPALFFGTGYGAGHLLGGSADTATGDHTADAAGDNGGHVTAVSSHEVQLAEGTQQGAEPQVVNIGRMMVPVYRSNSVSYVVADFGVAISNPDYVSDYMTEANNVQLRDAIYQSLIRAASGPILAGAAIDTDALSRKIQADITPRFTEVSEVLFLSLYKQDVPLS